MNVLPSKISEQDVNLSYPEDIKDKIIHLLQIFPVISPSMMQIGIGSSLPTKIWKPVLRQLILDKVVKEDFFVHPSAAGRQQSYTLLSLKDTPINFPKS